MTPSTRLFSKYLIHFFLICQISAISNDHENFSFLSRLLFRRRRGNLGASSTSNTNSQVNPGAPGSGMRRRYHRVKGNRGTPRFPTATTPAPTPSPTTRSPTPPPTPSPTPPPTPAPTRTPTPPPTTPGPTPPPVAITQSPTPAPSTSPSMNPTITTSPSVTPGARLVQVGNDLTGSVESEDFGNSISLAINARRVAIGAPYGGADANPETGAATVYQLSGNNWTAVGSPMYGVEQEDEFGETVSLSSAGTIIAISAPDNNNYLSVYEVDANDTWNKKGSDFIDANQGYISRDGTRIAVVGVESYFLSQFDFTASDWTKLIETPFDANVDAPKIAFSGVGNMIALGYPKDSTNSANAGKVTVMQYDGSLVQAGLDLFGTNSNDEFGHALALSNNGKVLAIGTDSANYVRVYDLDNTGWVLKGQEISDTEGNFGNALALSNNGLRIIIGQPNYNNRKGRAIVYQFENNSVWVQVGDPIVGDEEEYSEGSAVSISPDGGFVAAGTPEWVSNGQGIGRVRVFEIVDPPP